MKKWIKRLAIVLTACVATCTISSCKNGETDSSIASSTNEINMGTIAKKKQVLDNGVQSIAVDGDYIYAVSSKGSLYRTDYTGDVKSEFNLSAYERQEGIAFGKITAVYTSSSKNIWAVTDTNYLLKIQKTVAGKLTLLDYTKLGDSILGLIEKNNYLYLLERVGSLGCFKKFDLSKDLDEGLMAMGHLYKPEESGKTITLVPAKNLGILSFEIMEQDVNGEKVEYAYIVHTGGLLCFTTDCSQNGWKVQYDAMYPAEYEKQYAAAVAEKVAEGMSETDAKAAVDAALSTVKNKANNAVRSALGLASYDASTGAVKVPNASFDKRFYDNHPADEVSYRGVGYSVEEQKYYIVTNGFTVISCDANQTFREDTPVGLCAFLHEETNIVLPHRPELERNAMFYNQALNVGYVCYVDTDNVSCIDFNTNQIVFTESLGRNITSLVQAQNGKYLYYLTVNTDGKETEETVLYSYKLGNRWKEVIENLTKAPF